MSWKYMKKLKERDPERYRELKRKERQRYLDRMRLERPEKYKEMKRRHRSNNHGQRNEERKRRRDRIREFLNGYKAEHGCACGEKEPLALDFHHIDPSTKEIDVSKAVQLGWGEKRILEEINKCRVICANCHRKLVARQEI